jgi:hypothetical protein
VIRGTATPSLNPSVLFFFSRVSNVWFTNLKNNNPPLPALTKCFPASSSLELFFLFFPWLCFWHMLLIFQDKNK